MDVNKLLIIMILKNIMKKTVNKIDFQTKYKELLKKYKKLKQSYAQLENKLKNDSLNPSSAPQLIHPIYGYAFNSNNYINNNNINSDISNNNNNNYINYNYINNNISNNDINNIDIINNNINNNNINNNKKNYDVDLKGMGAS